MIHGTFTVKRVRQTSVCTLAEDARLDSHGLYKIHSTVLMPDVENTSSMEITEGIDPTCIKNNTQTSSKNKNKTKVQNYILAQYVGNIPYDDRYNDDPDYKTPAGTRFTLTCVDGNPNQRSFK